MENWATWATYRRRDGLRKNCRRLSALAFSPFTMVCKLLCQLPPNILHLPAHLDAHPAPPPLGIKREAGEMFARA